MKNFKKLILTSGISLISLFFNPAYSQEKKYSTIKGGTFYENGKYVVDGNSYGKKYEITDDKGRTWTKYYNVDAKNPTIMTGGTSWQISDKPQNPTSPHNYNKTYTQNKTNLGNALNATNSALNLGLNIANLIQDNQKQKNTNISYSNFPANNPPTNYNSNPKDNVDWWEENKNTNKNWFEEDESEKTENKKSFDEWLNGKEETENKNLWEENKQKYEIKYNSIDNIRAKKSSKELSDFVEKQVNLSPETEIWFNKEYQEAEEFYKEFYKNDPKAYAETKDLDKLHKIIGYNAYKLGEKSPAGPVLEGMETYNEIKKDGIEIKEVAEIVNEKTAEKIPGGKLMLKLDEKLYESMKDENGKNYWEEGYSGSSENIEKLFNEEVKEADEFLKQHASYESKLKKMSDEKNLEEKLGADIYIQKIELNEEIKKIAYESDIAKVIRYEAYQYAKRYTEAGEVLERIEKVDEMKKNNSGNWWEK